MAAAIVIARQGGGGEGENAQKQMRYVNMMRKMVSDELISPEEKFMLKNFRSLYDIDERSHAKALADVGWSVPEFDNGIKAGHVDTNASPSSLKLKNMIRTVSVRKQASEQIRQLKEAAERLMREKALNVREIIIYAMFMVVFTALSARGLNDEVRFRHHSALKSIIVGTSATNLYARVNTRETAADWLTSEFAAGLATQPFRSGEWRIVGPVRLSQLRGQKQGCGKQPEAWLDANGGEPFTCYGDDRGDWDPVSENKTDFRAFRYEKPNGPSIEEIRTTGFFTGQHSSHFNRVLPFAGFEVLIDPRSDVPCNETPDTCGSAQNARLGIAAQLEEVLGEGNYFDAFTKVLWVDLAVYSPGTQLVTWIRLSFESGRGGSVIVFDEFQTTEPWQSNEEIAEVAPLHVLVACGYLYYLVLELLELRSTGWKEYLSSVQNWIQLINIVFYVLQWVLKGIAFSQRPLAVSLNSASTFFDFMPCTRAFIVVKQVQACNVFLNWFKVVFFMYYVPVFGLLLDTLTQAQNTLLGFMLVFLVVFYGFAQAHAMIFGASLASYRTVEMSSYTLLQALLGDFDFDSLYATDAYMGPLFFVIYIMLAVLVILNMIIAIVADAYVDSKQTMEKKPEVVLSQDLKDFARYHAGLASQLLAVVKNNSAKTKVTIEESSFTGVKNVVDDDDEKACD